MDVKRRRLIINYHEELLRLYGEEDARSLAWTSKETQESRFEVMLSIAPDLSGPKILEVGHGFGDFYGYMLRKGMNPHYLGIDIWPRAIEIARKRYPGVRFEVRDIQTDSFKERFDFVIATGIFGIKAVCTKDYMYDIISKMWQLAEEGIAFTVNSNRTPEALRKGPDFYADPAEVLAFCLDNLSTKVHLFHGTYRFNDFSLLIWREKK